MARQPEGVAPAPPFCSATDSWTRAVVRASVPSSALRDSSRAASAVPAAPPASSSCASARSGATIPFGSTAASSSRPMASAATAYRTDSRRMSRWDLGKTGSPGFARSVSELSIVVRYRGSNARAALPEPILTQRLGSCSLGSIAKVALAVGVVAIGVVALARAHLRADRMQERLLATLPDSVADDPALVRFAIAEARPLFAQH